MVLLTVSMSSAVSEPSLEAMPLRVSSELSSFAVTASGALDCPSVWT